MKTAKQNDEILSYYMKEIQKIPLLSREEEVELAKKAKNGDKLAKEKIARANLRFVVSVAKKYQNRGLELSDLISEGNLGLLNAIEMFDESKGYHFISYAVWWIRQSILKALNEKVRPIRLPINKMYELGQIEKVKSHIHENLSEEEELAEISRMCGLKKDYVRDMINLSQDVLSFDREVRGNDGTSMTMGDFIEDKIHARPEDEAIGKNLVEKIDEVLSTLDDREAEIIRLRYGLSGRKALSLAEIGVQYNVSKERIRQIEKKAVAHLQSPRKIRHLEAFIA
jgi:RNA polymerase primary sigma factor